MPASLRAEYQIDPVGLGVGCPRLSWKSPSGEGVRQTACQIRAASAPELLATAPDRFDTGKRPGSESVFVNWPGEELGSREAIYWQVRTWLNGRPGDWSKIARLETGLLRPSDWTAKWIAFGDDGKLRAVPCPHFRKRFILPPGVVQARLYVSALGLCEFLINGEPVHPDEVLVGGWTDFRHRTQTVTFDVTARLREGGNVLGAILGDGWYGGSLGFQNNRQIYGGTPALLAQLEVRMESGKAVRVVSNRSWLGRTGPILASDLYNGEIHDARLELPGWSAPGSPDAGWNPVRVEKKPKLILDPKVCEPVRRVEEIKPQKLTEPVPGVYIFDLGQNIAGRARLRLDGRRGQTVTLRFGEMLNPDGTLYTANLRSAKATDTYTFGSDGTAEWEPRFTFHGFRYVELTGVTKRPAKSAIGGVVLHNAMTPTGTFECSDPRVNQLAANIRWGLRGNFLEVPTDCPQRDERLGWTGDIQVFAKTAGFLYDVDAFLRKWMRDLRDGQTAAGAFPDIAPTFICGFGNAAWADAGVIVPWVMYRRFGDAGILQENYDAMAKWITYQEKGFGDVSMNSFNHYAYGAVGEWMVHCVAGIAPGPDAPAYRHIQFHPQFCEGLHSASAHLETPYGAAGIEWETGRNEMAGGLVVPPNTFADFQPGLSRWKLANAAGKLVAKSGGTRPARILSGKYNFSGSGKLPHPHE